MGGTDLLLSRVRDSTCRTSGKPFLFTMTSAKPETEATPAKPRADSEAVRQIDSTPVRARTEHECLPSGAQGLRHADVYSRPDVGAKSSALIMELSVDTRRPHAARAKEEETKEGVSVCVRSVSKDAVHIRRVSADAPDGCVRIRRTVPAMLFSPRSPLNAETIGRRHVLSGTALSAFLLPQHLSAASFEEPRFLETLLQTSNIYRVNADFTTRASPSAGRLSAARLLRSIESQRAIFLGEHHPVLRDHLLQAALLKRLCSTNPTNRPLAVGLEAVQQQFQPVLDNYIAGYEMTEDQLFLATDWEKRWYWSFEAYRPIFRICREHGVKLIALDVNSEDKAKVELGGLASLERAKLLQYVSDEEGFARFGSTRAFDAYVSYTLRPPYNLLKKVGQKMTMSTNEETEMSFSNFVARQVLRDEAMASASAKWLTQNPNGLLLGLVGVNHVKFSCGVPARTARMLPGGLDVVTSVLLNPAPANTFTDPLNLRICDRTVVANEACVRNDIEVQNYVLQIPYAGATNADEVRRQMDEADAASVKQAKLGSSVLTLSDYMIFSPT